jgi:hypothetical protein
VARPIRRSSTANGRSSRAVIDDAADAAIRLNGTHYRFDGQVDAIGGRLDTGGRGVARSGYATVLPVPVARRRPLVFGLSLGPFFCQEHGLGLSGDRPRRR